MNRDIKIALLLAPVWALIVWALFIWAGCSTASPC